MDTSSLNLMQNISKNVLTKLETRVNLENQSSLISTATITESSYVTYGHLSAGTLAIFYLLQGVGRAAYEGNNRATYADVFRSQTLEAFAGQLVN